jgi:hypothetical protein
MPPARPSLAYCFLADSRVPIRAMPWFIASFLRVGIRAISRKANDCEQCDQHHQSEHKQPSSYVDNFLELHQGRSDGWAKEGDDRDNAVLADELQGVS